MPKQKKFKGQVSISYVVEKSTFRNKFNTQPVGSYVSNIISLEQWFTAVQECFIAKP